MTIAEHHKALPTAQAPGPESLGTDTETTDAISPVVAPGPVLSSAPAVAMEAIPSTAGRTQIPLSVFQLRGTWCDGAASLIEDMAAKRDRSAHAVLEDAKEESMGRGYVLV